MADVHKIVDDLAVPVLFSSEDEKHIRYLTDLHKEMARLLQFQDTAMVIYGSRALAGDLNALKRVHLRYRGVIELVDAIMDYVQKEILEKPLDGQTDKR